MKEYELLLNPTYLYFIQNPMEKPNFSIIAENVGLTRQTVAKQFESFKGLEVLNCFNIKNFYNEEQDKYRRAIMILRDISDEDLSLNAIADKLGTSRSNISKVSNHVAMPCIYIIKDNQQVVYIGSTEDFDERKQIHMQNIRNGIYDWCGKDAIIEVLWNNFHSKQERLEMEAQLIRVFQPIGNVEFKNVNFNSSL